MTYGSPPHIPPIVLPCAPSVPNVSPLLAPST